MDGGQLQKDGSSHSRDVGPRLGAFQMDCDEERLELCQAAKGDDCSDPQDGFGSRRWLLSSENQSWAPRPPIHDASLVGQSTGVRLSPSLVRGRLPRLLAWLHLVEVHHQQYQEFQRLHDAHMADDCKLRLATC